MSGIRYLAMLRRTGRAASDRVAGAIERAQSEHGLIPLYESPTLTVLAPATLPHVVVPDGSGIILGHLFERDGGTNCLAGATSGLDQPPVKFVELYWGGYLALRTRHAAAEALRDPSGSVPCYHLELDDVHLLAAEPSLLVDLGLVAAEIDWTIVSQALVYRDLRPARTALRGIDEVQPGVAMRILPPGPTIECAWSPWTFTARDREMSDPQEAIEAVRQAATKSVLSWASCFRRPLVEISGGLDSAIVAAVLSQGNARPRGITFRAVAGDMDETPYARAIADHLGIDLATVDPDITAIDLERSASNGLARANARSFAQALDRPERRHAEEVGADAYFSGGGGDNVFSYQRSLAPIFDRLRRQGLGRGVLETIGDMADLGETSPLNVAFRTARRALRRRPVQAWATSYQFLARTAVADLPWPAGHPWLPVPNGTLPGKRAHVMALIRVQNHLDGHGRQAHAPIIFPLLSQPLMETCLAIPSWLWCAGGRNRAVARAAFEPLLPPIAVGRQSKGAFDSLCTQAAIANKVQLRDLLLDGALAREGLLDLPAIRLALEAAVPAGLDTLRLLALADVAAWVHGWEARSNADRPAAARP
ncbi:asparagine synthase-related protein [Sphingomonas sp. PWP1-2]|uniref:asparagine synthase-related protein n=1 Tax=Sphingomonas sp. PWP1-2 TaxID=2804558 RepID=UPI003CE83BAA